MSATEPDHCDECDAAWVPGAKVCDDCGYDYQENWLTYGVYLRSLLVSISLTARYADSQAPCTAIVLPLGFMASPAK